MTDRKTASGIVVSETNKKKQAAKVMPRAWVNFVSHSARASSSNSQWPILAIEPVWPHWQPAIFPSSSGLCRDFNLFESEWKNHH